MSFKKVLRASAVSVLARVGTILGAGIGGAALTSQETALAGAISIVCGVVLDSIFGPGDKH